MHSERREIMKIAIMGPPGGGKGTQAEKLSTMFSIPHISTGAIIRNAIREKSSLGIAAEQYIKEGELVPDELVIDMVSGRISEPDCENGYILDGFPRTITQAQAMDEIGIFLDHVINLVVKDDVIVTRLGGRRECKVCAAPYHIKFKPSLVEGVCDSCGGELITRTDDVPETIRQRLDVYHAQTEPLIRFYENKGILLNVTGRDTVEDTTKAVLNTLGVSGQ